MMIHEIGGLKTDDVFYCMSCKKEFKRPNVTQVAFEGLKLWKRVVGIFFGK